MTKEEYEDTDDFNEFNDNEPCEGCVSLTAEVRRLRERERVLVDWLKSIAEVEQSHCYMDINDSDFNDTIKTRHALRTCGDRARAAIEAVKE